MMELNWAICPSLLSICSILKVFEPAYEIMVLFVLHKLILQTHIRSHPVVLDVWFLVGPYVYFHTLCVHSEGSGETAWMCRLAWAFAGRLCDKYHNLMSWLILPVIAKWQCSVVSCPSLVVSPGTPFSSITYDDKTPSYMPLRLNL